MAYEGYFTLGPTGSEVEIINVARTEAYAANSGLRWFKPVYKSKLLPTLVPGGPYVNPTTDDAPWYDPDDVASGEFFGLYPLSVTGLEDSTRSSSVVESTLDGGIPGRLRYGTKTAVFAGILIATSQRGAEYGFRWLNRVTEMKTCLPSAPNYSGNTLHYLSADPDMDSGCAGFRDSVLAAIDGGYFIGNSMIQVDDPLIDGGGVGLASLHDGGSSGTPGPTLEEGGSASTPGGLMLDAGGADGGVDFGPDAVFDGGSPTQTGGPLYVSTPPFYLPDVPVTPFSKLKRTLRKFKINNGPKVLSKNTMSDGGAIWTIQMTGVAGTPWEFGDPTLIFNGFSDAAHDPSGPYAPGITPGIYDNAGASHHETACAQPVWTPVYDPTCGVVQAPPTLPLVSGLCWSMPINWWRRRAQIPAEYIPLWADAVPVLSIETPDTGDMTSLRVRFYADPNNTGQPDDNPCEIVGDWVVTYAPASHTLVIDGIAEAVYVVDSNGIQRRADSLIVSSEGGPFSWPQLSCGYGYTMTVDMLDSSTPMPPMDLALVPRAS